jgi:N-acyl-D-aspartate/D-glutamate deacylase
MLNWIVVAFVLFTGAVHGAELDLAINYGRVMDPETGLDAVRHVGILNGTIVEISEGPLSAKTVLDASGKVVAPGFINLHWHGTEPGSNYYEAMDGVTATFELEIGVSDVDAWYDQRAGRMPIHYGVAIGHAPVRMKVMHDPGEFLPAGDAARKPASNEELASIAQWVEKGLQRGAVGIGFGLAYTPSATHWEILEMFRIAARYKAGAFVHIRGASSAGSSDREQGLLEVIGHSAISGTPVHVAHINSSGQSSTSRMLEIMMQARSHGIDVTTECYPYTAGATRIESFLFDSWMDKPEAEYQKLQWALTGERLTRESFLRYRKQGGLVFIHANSEEVVRAALSHPLTMIASDGFDVHEKSAHPRSAGTYSRTLGRYARDQNILPLMSALEKMTIMPARRLEARVPQMRRKGRIQIGADADIVVFDHSVLIDRATFERPASYSVGMQYVLVAGEFVVRDGVPIVSATPGRPVRANIE